MIIKYIRGQSIFEYVIFLAAVILVCLIFLGPSGFFKQRVERSLNYSITALESMVNNINVQSGY